MSVLEINNIKKSFGKTEVLKGISFSLNKGEVLSIFVDGKKLRAFSLLFASIVIKYLYYGLVCAGEC